MSRFLPDTNVFSEIFKGNAEIKNLVESLDAVIDATIYIECLQGAQSRIRKSVLSKAIEAISRFC